MFNIPPIRYYSTRPRKVHYFASKSSPPLMTNYVNMRHITELTKLMQKQSIGHIQGLKKFNAKPHKTILINFTTHNFKYYYRYSVKFKLIVCSWSAICGSFHMLTVCTHLNEFCMLNPHIEMKFWFLFLFLFFFNFDKMDMSRHGKN